MTLEKKLAFLAKSEGAARMRLERGPFAAHGFKRSCEHVLPKKAVVVELAAEPEPEVA